MTPYLGNEGKKTSFPLEIQAAPKASAAVPTGRVPITPGSCFGWQGQAAQVAQAGRGCPLWGPSRHMMGFGGGGTLPGWPQVPRPQGHCGVSESGARFTGDRLMSNNWVTMAKSIPKILFCFPENSLPIFFPSKSCHSAITQILTNLILSLFFQVGMSTRLIVTHKLQGLIRENRYLNYNYNAENSNLWMASQLWRHLLGKFQWLQKY